MEGVSHEAASFAGHLRLGKLIGFYDDNRITIDGRHRPRLQRRRRRKRFEAYGWHVLHVADVQRPRRRSTRRSPRRRPRPTRPSLIVVRTHIGLRQPEQARTPPRRTASRSARTRSRSRSRRSAGRRRSRSSCRTRRCAHWREASRAAARRSRPSGSARYERVRAAHPDARRGARAAPARRAAGRLGRRRSRLHAGERQRRDARRVAAWCSTRIAKAAGADRRLGRPRAVEQHDDQGRGRRSRRRLRRAATCTSAFASTAWARS